MLRIRGHTRIRMVGQGGQFALRQREAHVGIGQEPAVATLTGLHDGCALVGVDRVT